jgi:hypothetical protein
VIVPEHPEELVAQFLPHYVERLLGNGPEPRVPGAARTGLARGPAPVGVGLRVVGAGEWTLRVVERRLVVEAGIAADVALQISLAEADFEPLVLAPLRRAVALHADREAAPGNTGNGLWSRLGRWDEETVDLLRCQSGGILLRVDDAGTKRNVALSPGNSSPSLESAACTIDCKLADLIDLQNKRSNPLDLFYAGQIRISGDAQIALAMAGLFL